MRCEHFQHRGECYAWFVTEFRDIAVARIEMRECLGGIGDRVIAAVVIADSVSQFPVTVGAAAFFDPGMLIRRDALRSELAADPVILLGENDFEPVACRGESTGDAAEAATDDNDIGLEFSGPLCRLGFGKK